MSREPMHDDHLNRSGILSLVGGTPLVPLERMNPNPKVRLLAKMESKNPGGSIKDRIALRMIESAEASGELTPDKTILEATSGNTGIGLALVAAVKGYKILLAMSEGVSLERRKILAALGADFLLTQADKGTDGAIEEAYRLAREEPDRFFLPDQYNNPNNVLAHYHGTAEEIWRQTNGSVTHFVAAMGTTGTLMGCSRRLKEFNPTIRILGVEPYLGHKIQGLKNLKEAYLPGIFDGALLDEKVNIEDEAAFETTRELARAEGLLAGMSSGAALRAALNLAQTLDSGTIVVILPDGGERYLSTSLFVVPEDEQIEPVETRLELTNTLTRRRDVFDPIEAGRAGIYTCGPTLHRRPHMGFYRRLVLADTLRRYLEAFHGLEVTHVVSMTDLDDNVLETAKTEGKTPRALADQVERAFFEDQEALSILPAAAYPRSTDELDAMLDLARRLVQAGFAYEELRSLYFDVSKLPEYGSVSGMDPDKLQTGKTVDLERYEKHDPKDFTLLRRCTLAELRAGFYLSSEWGNVRPSWHLQCAAMAMAAMGEHFDIHVSGTDLLFPHHENTVAQVQALTGAPPSRFALHAELVLNHGRKMSWSSGTALSLPDLLDRGFTGRHIRFFLVSTHYRQPIHFSMEALEESRQALYRLDDFVHNLSNADGQPSEEIEGRIAELREEFKSAMDDDLNVSAALAALFRFARRINRLIAAGRVSRQQVSDILSVVAELTQILGFVPEAGCPAGPEVLELIERRNKARTARDYDTADRIREDLKRRGIIVEDTPQGTRWRRSKEGNLPS